jgi:hypothetical protein
MVFGGGFKESKGLLGLCKCQASNFASPIAATSMVVLLYNTLSLVKRFTAYETIGKLFEDATKKSQELTVTQRIWEALQEIVIIITNLFDLTDEDVFEAVIYKSDELAHICDIYKLKLVS